jgi:uncharacterized protein YjdB
MKPLYLTRFAVAAAILLANSFGAFAQTTTFSTAGGPFAYTVPNGVTSIGINSSGGMGGGSLGSTTTGGLGGNVVCSLAVSSGQVINVYVGGQGTNYNGSTSAGGANGGGNGYYNGGGGGGASDIRVGGTALANRVIVAGGGGGGGYLCGGGNDKGGNAGGSTGANGSYCNSYYSGYCGSGASATSGGSGATGGGGTGGLGFGGNSASNCCSGQGGGGGGYYGGGGGANYGGGGGGSSYILGAGVSNATSTGAFRSGGGVVTICAPNLGSIFGTNSVCPGSITTLATTGSGGTWSSGNTSIASIDALGNVTGVAAGSVLISYAATVAGCGSAVITSTVIVNPLPTAILGTANACIGLTSSLSDAGGGTWSSSNSTIANANSATGVVTGTSVGSVTITYTLPVTGCSATVPFVVNPLPAFIGGAPSVCAGGATTILTDVNPGGTWTSADPTIASVTSGSGIVTGGNAGSVIISYTLPTGCTITRNMLVNLLPTAIIGSNNVCLGATTALSDAGGGTWSSSNVSIASVGPTGITSGVGAGTATITYSLSSGCSITAPILVNPAPAPITGVLSFCNGSGTSLTSATPGGTWSSSSTAIATVVPSSGVVNSVSSGLPIITYQLPTGCNTTMQVTINALPTAFLVTGGGAYCAGTGGVHIGLGLSTVGVNYSLYQGPTLVTPLGGSNSALDFGIYTANGTYTVIGTNAATGCTNNMSGSTTIVTNPLPNIFNVTGGGNFCPGGTGVNVTQGGSVAGINYQLNVGGLPTGAAVAGTGAPLNFGPQTFPGVYTVTAISPATGCSVNMVGSAAVVVNLLPAIHTISSGGNICTGSSGVAITLDGSNVSTNYQLFFGGTPVGSAHPGTGSVINFGLQTGDGTYTIVATNTATGCVNTMAGLATISVNPLPLVFSVTGGGGFCPGGPGAHVNLNYSVAGVNYQLYRGAATVGGPVAGSNAGLDFGLQGTPGSYSVVGINAATGCSANMTGSANVFINPAPSAHLLTGGGNYCAGGTGVHIGLDGSNSGITYQLLFGGTAIGGPVAGTGSSLDFGIKTGVGVYSVLASNNTTACFSNMPGALTVGVNSLPAVDSVIAAGTSFCAGGTGIDVLLTGSDIGVTYQLYRGGAATGSPVDGTGSFLDFGLRTLPGLYTIIARHNTTTCTNTMFGGANITINPAPAVYVVNGGGAYCMSGAGAHVGLTGSTLGVTYRLLGTGAPTDPTFVGTGSGLDFGLQTAAGAYTVVAQNDISGCISNMAGAAIVTVNALPAPFIVSGSGAYCAGTAGNHVYLSGSVTAKHYQLYNGTTAVGAYRLGFGSVLDFGTYTSGNYTVMATDPSTGCSASMPGVAMIMENASPAAQPVTGGGAYCAGGAGISVGTLGSVPGVNYQLMHGGSPYGSVMMGTGTAIDFGPQSLAGSYTVIATDSTTTCHANMPGSASVTITLQPTVQSVTGSGAYCAGGAGLAVGLSGTNPGIFYQVMSGGSAVGGLVAGTGAPLTLATLTAAGSYTVLASPGGLCQTNMSGSADITISPLPTLHAVTGGGSYCSGDTGRVITLNGSDAGIHYQLFQGSSASGSFMPGSGSPITFGTHTAAGLYTVVATNALTGCMATMTGSSAVSVIAAPTVFNVVGGGAYCAGGNGVSILLAGSNTNVNYQLQQGGTDIGAAMAGTGTTLDFGLTTVAGNYTIVGKDAVTACVSNMHDTATVTINPIVTPSSTVVSLGGTTISMGQRDTVQATVTNGGADGPAYQWSINRFPIAGATNSMFISTQFNNGDTVACSVTSSGMCGGITVTKFVVMSVLNSVYVSPVAAGISDVKVMPNPSKGNFTITGSIGANNDQEIIVEVTDMLGHMVYNGKIMSVNGSINDRVQTTGLANGMYLLNLRSNTGNQVFHIVIEQ